MNIRLIKTVLAAMMMLGAVGLTLVILWSLPNSHEAALFTTGGLCLAMVYWFGWLAARESPYIRERQIRRMTKAIYEYRPRQLSWEQAVAYDTEQFADCEALGLSGHFAMTYEARKAAEAAWEAMRS